MSATCSERPALLGRCAGDLLEQHGDADPAPARRPGAVLHGDVVVGDDRHDSRAALRGSQFGGHLEVHDVAGVVLDDMQHAGAAVDELGRGQHLLRHGGGEDLARAGRVQHAEPDEPAVQWLVTRPAAGDDPDLAAPRRVAPVDDLVLVVDPEFGMRGLDTQQRVGDDVRGSLMSFFMMTSSAVDR